MNRAQYHQTIMDSMARELAGWVGCTREELLATGRGADRVRHARHHLWWGLRNAGLSYKEITRLVGRGSHAPILRACSEFERLGVSPLPIASLDESGSRLESVVVKLGDKERREGVGTVVGEAWAKWPSQSYADQRGRYEHVVAAMLDGRCAVRARGLWRWYCWREWPESAAAQVEQLPRAYVERMRAAA